MTALNKVDQQFDDITRDIMANGDYIGKRNGVRICTFGQTILSDMSDGFPIVTRRKTFFQSAVKELLAMIAGNTMADGFGSKIWEQWGLSKDDVRLQNVDQVDILLSVAELKGYDKAEATAVAEQAIKDGVLKFPHWVKGEVTEHEHKVEDGTVLEELADAVLIQHGSNEFNKFVFELFDEEAPTALEASLAMAALLDGQEVTREYVTEFLKAFEDKPQSEVIEAIQQAHPNTVLTEVVNIPKGYCGPIYGAVWNGNYSPTAVNQIEDLERRLKAGGDDKMIIDGWVPELVPDDNLPHDANILNGKQVLAPCHVMYVFNIIHGKLNLEMVQRSGDHLVGVPFNHVHCALWVHMLAYLYDLKPGRVKHNITNSHIYESQLQDIDLDEYLEGPTFELPELVIDTGADEVNSVFDFKPEHFSLKGYEHGEIRKIRVES